MGQKLDYVLHICSWSIPFSHLPSVHPAPGFLVEILDSMLEAGEVIKQSGKEFLSALPMDSNMFTVCNNILNECHCGKMCHDQADLTQHVTDDHPANSMWNCNFCAHNSTKRDYI